MLREYPRGLGDAVHATYLEQLKTPAHGDLRMKITPDESKTDIQLFEAMENLDWWNDANLKPCFDYLYQCKYTRTVINIVKHSLYLWYMLIKSHII